jgi:hypothetical protein
MVAMARGRLVVTEQERRPSAEEEKIDVSMESTDGAEFSDELCTRIIMTVQVVKSKSIVWTSQTIG